MAPSIKEGTIPFDYPSAGKQCETWYKIVGDLSSGITPVVTLHGGPGISHDYMIQFSDLYELYGIPVIFYDQLGCARSTHLREKAGDETFWTEELFVAELNNLVEKLGVAEKGYDVIGHSWGGMFGSTWAGTRPKGLRKLVLSNSPAFMKGWTDAFGRFLEEMEEPYKSVIVKAEREKNWDGENMEEAMMAFMKKHSAKVMPPEFFKSFGFLKEDDTVNMTMSGPSEFHVLGGLRDWTAAEKCKSIEVPTLVINGVNEGASDEAIKPYLDGIKGVKYVKFHNSTHCPLYEEKELYLKTIGEWLLEK